MSRSGDFRDDDDDRDDYFTPAHARGVIIKVAVFVVIVCCHGKYNMHCYNHNDYCGEHNFSEFPGHYPLTIVGEWQGSN